MRMTHDENNGELLTPKAKYLLQVYYVLFPDQAMPLNT